MAIKAVGLGVANFRRGQASLLSGSFWRIAGPVAAILLWQLAAAVADSIAILPTPLEVLQNFLDNFSGSPALEYLGLPISSYAGNLWFTSQIVLASVAVGGVLGVVAGTASARLQWVRNITEPVTTLFGVVPVLVAAPFFLVWFGSGTVAKFVLVAFFTTIMVGVVAQAAALALSPSHEEYAAALGVGTWGRLVHVTIPATFATDLTAIRTALGQAWGLEAIAELLGSPAGVGRAIAVRAGTGDVASILALVLALGVLALVFDGLLRLIIHFVNRWQPQGES